MNSDERIKRIIGCIEKLSGQYSSYQIFSDWVQGLALEISNACTMHRKRLFEDREKELKQLLSKYSPEDMELFGEMTAYLVEELEENPSDALGTIFMRGGFGSGITGQFFTPFNLSMLTAQLAAKSFMERVKAGEKISINEPTCGSGGMIIAAAVVMKNQGINYQSVMEVVAQDLDWRSVHMCYVQLSLLGISAIVVQGDTLAEPFIRGEYPESRILITPKKAGVLL